MLISTGVGVELLQEFDQLLFSDKGIWGGLNGLGAVRHSEANNKYLENLNPN